MPDDRLRKLIEANRKGTPEAPAATDGRLAPGPAERSNRERFAEERPYRLWQNQKRYAPPRAAAVDAAHGTGDKADDLPRVTGTPPAPTRKVDGFNQSTRGGSGEETRPAIRDEGFVYDEAVDRDFDFVSPPATKHDGGKVTPTARDETFDPPTVIVTPPSPTEGIEDSTETTSGGSGDDVASVTPDEEAFYDEAVDRDFVLVSPPSVNLDGAKSAPASRDEIADERIAVVATSDSAVLASPNLVQNPAAEPKVLPSQAARKRIPGIKDSIRSDPRSAKIQLPAGLSVENWKQKGPYASLVLNNTGVSAALRGVEKVFGDTPMEDDVVDELENTAHLGNISESSRTQRNASYQRLIDSVSSARQTVEKTLSSRGKLLSSEHRSKIEAMMADLSTLESKLEGRRALLSETASADVVASATERLRIPELLAVERADLSRKIDKLQKLLANCDTLGGVSQAFQDNNPYRSLSNIQSLFDKIEFHHPGMTRIAGTDAYNKKFTKSFLWQASIAPQAEVLRKKFAAQDPAYDQKRKGIEEDAQEKLREIEADISRQYGPDRKKHPVEAETERRERSKIIEGHRSAMMKSLEGEIRVEKFPEIKQIVDKAKLDLNDFEKDLKRIFLSVQQQLDTAASLAPSS